MDKYWFNSKKFGAFVTAFFCCLFLIALPNAIAELVTAYTFEQGTELQDVAVMLGGGGVASDDLTCSGTCNFVAGVFGQGVELVGLTDYLRTASNSTDLDPGPNGFTVAFFTYGTSFGSVGGHIVTKYIPINGWEIVCNSSIPRVDGQFHANGAHSLVRALGSTVEGNWYHVAVTYDGGKIGKLYINGILMATDNNIVFNPSGVAMYLATPSHSPGQADHGYAGFIDDFAIFNEVLTDDDILLLSEEGLEAFMGYTPEPSPLTQNLIGYWKLDGNGADSSGNGRDLDLFGSVGFPSGLFGSALGLAGNPDQYARRPTDDNIYDFGATDFTIQVWVNFNSIEGEQILIEKLYGPSGPGWSLTYYERNSKWHFFAPPFARIYTVDQIIALDVWHQIILRRSGTDIDLFYDNNIPDREAFSEVNDLPIPDTFFPLLVGKRNELDDRGFALKGKLDEIAIWNRALTNDEIDLLWNGGSGTEMPPLPTPNVSGYIEVGGTPLEGASVTVKQHQKPQTTETINGHFQLESADTAQGCTITIKVPETQ